MLDAYGRKIDYMRVSVTDKCNLRCRYCMPEGVDFIPMQSLLSMEEITAVCRQASYLGIDKIKITGGEPLVRRGVTDLVRLLKEEAGIRQVTMTTNGLLLAQFLPDLLKNGLDAINISLDTLDKDIYQAITGRDQLDVVLDAIQEAADSGLRVKINSVLMKGLNDQAWKDLVRMAEKLPVDVRFIEMMPIGAGEAFEPISNKDLLCQMSNLYPDMVKDIAIHGNGPALYYKIPGYLGSIGFISPMHGKFCGSCNRIRMTAIGDLKPCLCYESATNIRDLLREQGEDVVGKVLRQVILQKPEAHCFEEQDQITEKSRMIAIGG